MFLGVLAVFFFLIAWVILTAITLKKGRNKGDVFVNLFFLLGVLFFTIYSVQVGEIMFILLNGVALVLATVNFYYIPHKFRKMEKEIKSAERKMVEDISFGKKIKGKRR